MTKIGKLIERFNSSPTPKDITMDEIRRLAEHYGCIVISGGNHPVKIVHIKSGTVIPLPQHDKVVKRPYVEELKKLFDMIEEDRK